MEHRHIKHIDRTVVVGSVLAILLLIIFIRPVLNSPINGMVSQGPVLFSFEKGNAILIDDNPEFTSPQRIEVEDNLVVNLKPGTYYWKVEGALTSEIRNLTINSVVDLKLRRNGENYSVVNAGNDLLDVDIYNQGVLTGKVVLDVDQSENVSGTKFVGSQHG